MFFVVKIKNFGDKLVVPAQWVNNIKLSRALNYGLNKNKTYLMFYSSNDKKEPDFTLNIQGNIIQEDFCFFGNILKSYGN